MSRDQQTLNGPLRADYVNRETFHGSHTAPAGHSRFPIVPSSGYGGLSFDPSMRHNPTANAPSGKSTKAESQQEAWLRAIEQSLGNLIEIPIVDA